VVEEEDEVGKNLFQIKEEVIQEEIKK